MADIDQPIDPSINSGNPQKTPASPDNPVPPGQSLIVDPYGQLRLIDSSQFHEAISTGGFKSPSPEQSGQYMEFQKYGQGFGNAAKAAALGLARGATFGVSDEGAVATGLAKPEEIAGLERQHPWISEATPVIGALGSIALGPETAMTEEAAAAAGLTGTAAKEAIAASRTNWTPVGLVGKAVEKTVGTPLGKLAGAGANTLANPETSPVANKIISKLGQYSANVAGSALEGQFFGLGRSVTEDAMGDPNAFGEKLWENMKTAGLWGGLMGGMMAPIGDSLAGLKSLKAKNFPKEIQEAALTDGIREDGANAAYAKPESTGDLKSIVDASHAEGIDTNLPAAGLLNEAIKDVPDMKYPVHGLQTGSLESRAARDIYTAWLETTSPEAQAARTYEALQKTDLKSKFDKTIQDIAPNTTLNTDAVKAGNETIEGFKKQYDAEKESLQPFWDKWNQTNSSRIDDPTDLITTVNNNIPKMGKYISSEPAVKVKPPKQFISSAEPKMAQILDLQNQVSSSGDRVFKIAPYEPTMPVSKNTYGAISDLVDAANKGDLTMEDIQHLRESMRDRVMDRMKVPRDTMQIDGLRKDLLTYLENRVDKIETDPGVRDTFKKYAINEGNRNTIEKIFGGSISDYASFTKEIKPERVLDRIFSNTVSTQAAKEILGPQAFNKAVADYMKLTAEGLTDRAKGGFRSQPFNSFLKRESPAMNVAFAENPQVLKRLTSLTDIMRILPDAPPPNISRTAPISKILDTMHSIGTLLSPKKALGEGLQAGVEGAEKARITAIANEMMKGKSLQDAENAATQNMGRYSVLKKIEDMAGKTTKRIMDGTENIFDFYNEKQKGYLAPKLIPTINLDDHKKKASKLLAYSTSPESLINDLHDNTKDLYGYAPKISTALSAAAGRANGFLASKVPRGTNSSILAPEYVPSNYEIAKFNRYFKMADDPISALHEVASGSLTPETLETLNTVYPKLYGEMKQSVMERLSKYIAKKDPSTIPYKTRIGISNFLGVDVDNSLSQPSIAANQIAMQNIQAKNDAQNNQILQPTPKSNEKGLGKISLSDRMELPLQANSHREA